METVAATINHKILEESDSETPKWTEALEPLKFVECLRIKKFKGNERVVLNQVASCLLSIYLVLEFYLKLLES